MKTPTGAAPASEAITGTAAAKRFADESRRITLLFAGLVAVNKAFLDQVIPKKHLPPSEFAAEIAKLFGMKSPEKAMARLRLISAFEQHAALVAEMGFCRTVDNYLSYVSEALTAVFLARPEVLRSGEQEKLDFILTHKTMDDLVASIAEKKVDRLAYVGFRGLAEYFVQHLGVTITSDDSAIESIGVDIQIRNLLVHNRGVINGKFLSAVGDGRGKLGERITVGVQHVGNASTSLLHSALELDQRLAAKFGLETEPINIKLPDVWEQ